MACVTLYPRMDKGQRGTSAWHVNLLPKSLYARMYWSMYWDSKNYEYMAEESDWTPMWISPAREHWTVRLCEWVWEKMGL